MQTFNANPVLNTRQNEEKYKEFPLLLNLLLIDKLVVTLFVMCGNGWMEEVAFVIIMKRPYCSIAYYYAALGRANVS